MPTEVTNYQCPACTGPLHFDGASGKLECEYCGSSYAVAEIEALYEEKDAQAESTHAAAQSGASEDWSADGDGMQAFVCPSCGAELVCDETTAATSCPYCGNPGVVPGQFTGVARPDFVIPFKPGREDAIKALKKHYRGKPLLPSVFTNENRLEEIQGVYVPFWLFDTEAEGDVSYQATRMQTHTMGDYEIPETDHFDVRRVGTMSFEKIPVDASSKMPDDYMDSIEPCDYSELKTFSKDYLPGFLADKYDRSAEESSRRADARCESSILSALGKTVNGYTTCVPVNKNVRLQRDRAHYALLPVWMLSTSWNGKNFLFAMDGLTGRLVGDGRDGIMLLSTKERDYALFRYGEKAACAFNEYGLAKLEEVLLDNFAENDRVGGFEDYIRTCASFLKSAGAGKPVSKSPVTMILIFAAASLAIAAIVCAILAGQMKTVHKKTNAGDYASGSVRLTGQFDQFTHRTQPRRKIERSGESGSGQSESDGGGSGRSGKF